MTQYELPLGYRVFSYSPEYPLLLKSLTHYHLWIPGWNKALMRKDDAVGGFYSWTTLAAVSYYCAYAHIATANLFGTRYVVGRIAMRGVVVCHEYGYRSEYARIHTLYCLDRRDRVPNLQAEYFGVPLEESHVLG